MNVKAIVTDIAAKSKTRGKVDGVYFVACGGSLLALYPARYLLERESKTLKVGHYTANEFVHATPKSLTKNSIAVFCSLMGTPETEDACQTAKDAGACTISFCGNPEARMAKIADYVVPFKSIAKSGTRYMESNAAPALQLAFELLHQLEDYPHYEQAMQAFAVLDDITEDAQRYFAPRAEQFAAQHQQDGLINILAGGPALGVGYGFSICSLMEMQWINAPLINTGEFFHGPFEIVDRQAPFVVFLTEGRNRPVDERALGFLQQYGGRITVVDAKELGINRMNDAVCEYFNHFVLDAAQRLILDKLAAARKHDWMSRRYMWHVKY